ncbi:amino acid adenylation domain-containing protein [Tychonema sp. BBK16]|uniref:amino acid adenylation domain-containing protein n=2 Tax=Tychonema sp. BBK16 TaxID=2699888 RepID=UPI0030DB2A76
MKRSNKSLSLSKKQPLLTMNKLSYKLSPMQAGMLFNHLQSEQPGVDIEQMICSLHEDLNISTLTQAWQRVFERHPILRTSFAWQGLDEPMQTVDDGVQIPLEYQDWSQLSKSDREQKLQAYLKTDRQQGFDLTQPPLMRLALFQLEEANYKLIWTFHHILLDGRSLQLILKEVFAFYEAFNQGEDLQLTQPLPYQDYIEWLERQDFGKSEAFWRTTLNGFTTPTPLVIDRVTDRKNNQELGHGEQECRLSEAATEALKSLARSHELTLNTLVQGAWALLLSRYSGEEDVVFATTRACRRSTIAGGELMIGIFINTLPIRVRVSPDLLILPWLAELRQQWINLRDYEHTPLIQVQQWSDIPGGVSLFDSLLVFENYQMTSALQSIGDSWQCREFQLLEQTSFPLTVAGYAGTELLLKIEYDRQKFDRAAIGRMLGHLQTLLEGIVANPNQSLGDLTLLTETERHQLLVEWNNTHSEFPDRCMHDLFEIQVEKTPDAVAVVSGNQQLTYRELNAKANQLAHYLRSLGVGPDVLVGISIERSLEMAVGFLGIFKAGGAYVPLDPNYPSKRLAFMIEDSQIKVLLTQSRLVGILPDYSHHIVCLDSDWEPIAQYSQDNPLPQTTSQNLAYVIYTSGSTGKPKGVMITHQGLVNHNIAMINELNLQPSDRILQFASISFDIAVEEIFPSWITGMTIILRPEEIFSSIKNLFQFCEQEQLTILDVPTAFWHEMVGEMSVGKLSLPSSLRLIVVGGEAASLSLYLTWLQLVGDRCRWVNTYGPTETTVTATVYNPPVLKSDETLSEIPIGRPLANTQIYILDQQLQPVPIGVSGEMHIGGAGVARGYLNRPERNASKFMINPFTNDPNARLYKTGDSARYLPDGNIEFIGRIDFQVKIRGFRIELREIEAAMEKHPAVQQAVVLAREDVSGNKRLIAYVIPNSESLTAASAVPPDTMGDSCAIVEVMSPQEQILDSNRLRQFVQKRLPEYMIPAGFVFLNSLPLNPNGKVDRKALANQKCQLSTIESNEVNTVPPRDDLELQVAKMWEKVLGINAIGVTDNFFEKGGHSLLAMRLLAEIERTFDKKLPLSSIFQSPTVEQLANILRDNNWSSPSPSMVVIQPGTGGDKPPIFCIHVLGRGLEFYRPMLAYLDKSQPLLGLSTQIMDRKLAPPNRVEELAAYYIKEMQTFQPMGPYLMLGVSFGGTVAFEIARQLFDRGEKVALLGFFDTYGLRSKVNKDLSVIKKTNLITRLLELKPAVFLEKAKSNLRGKVEMLTYAIYRILVKFYRAIDRPLPIYLEDFNHGDENEDAAKQYIAGIYPGQAILFKAVESAILFGDDHEMGWGEVVTGGIEVHEIPSSHLGMLKEPHVQLLGETLQAIVDRT